MRNFRSFINNAELEDLPLKGALYTWTNGHASGLVMNRIDRFLVSHEWMSKYAQLTQTALARITSDHKPLLLDLGGASWGSAPFRFEDMWFLVEGFEELVENWWAEMVFEGTSSFIFWSKLKALKGKLKVWNTEVLGRIDIKLNTILEQIDSLDKLEQQGPLTDGNFDLRLSLKTEYIKLASMEEASWKQKSRISFLQNGDNNTKYFHRYANVRRNHNAISSLRFNGQLTTDRAPIKEGVVDYFTQLYKEENCGRPLLDQINFSRISDFEKTYLERSFTEDEILSSIKALAKDKAPGPDGFPISFFLRFWNVIKTDYLALIVDFYNDSYFDWRINTTFITLLPKKNQAEDPGDFRPISLLSSTYKVLAKTLASRLKLVMNKLVAETQTTYIKGRNIADGILVANELVDSRLKSSIPGVICKVDMEKAFDRISWKYLEYIFTRMGFDWKWRSWIRQCLSSASFSILINGTPCGFFGSSRGVRQGDPLSALIFDLAMEGLSQMLIKGSSLGRISGFKVKATGLSVSHLQYADDTIIFLDFSWDMIEFCLSILKCFEIISGLRINMAKTKLIGIGATPHLKDWALILGCSTEALPTTYLGLPLGCNPREISMWDPVLESLDKRLTSWSSKTLSRGGKLTLIKSTLSNLPIYYLSVFLAPVKVIHMMERKIRKFLWANGIEDKPYHFVNWAQVCSSKEDRGLGVKHLQLMNKALLSKWCWRFGSEVNALWRKLMVEKFGYCTRWTPNITRITQGVGCWRRIVTLYESYNKDLVFEVNSGIDIRFWQDHWVDGGSLAATCPLLFSLSKQKKCTIKKMTMLRNNQTIWNFSFSRELNELESEEMTILLQIIGPPPVSLIEASDVCHWKIAPTESFSVSRFYDYHSKISSQPLAGQFPFKFKWKSPVPARVKFFTWLACLNRCLTVDNLNKRGRFIVSRCPLCKASLETIAHLLLNCPFSLIVWAAFALGPEGSWQLPAEPIELALNWKPLSQWSRRGKDIWYMLPIAIWWGLWIERNSRTFQRKESTSLQVINHIRNLMFSWSTILPSCKELTLRELTINWATCITSI